MNQMGRTDQVFLINEGHHACYSCRYSLQQPAMPGENVTTSEQSGITMSACQVNAQIGIAEWLANGPYHEWRLQSYKCVMGKHIPKNET
jgi:hypothetical protein